MKAIDAGDWEIAWVALKQAYSLNPSWKIRYNLGIASVNTGRYLEGARLLSDALVTCRHECPEDVRRHGEEHYRRAEAHVGQVRVRTDIPGAVVLVDGARLTDAQARGWHIEPGSHDVVVRGTDESQERTVDVPVGSVVTVEFMQDDAAQAEKSTPRSPDARSPDPADAPSNTARNVVLFSGIGATTIAAGFTTAFLAVAGARQKDLNALRESIESDGRTCNGSTSSDCSELTSVADRRDSATTAAQVAAITTGVLAAVTLVTVLVWPRENSKGSLNAQLELGPGTINFGGTF